MKKKPTDIKHIKYAVTQLEISLETLTINERISRTEGKTEQADMGAVHASEIRQALAILKAAGTGPIWPEPYAEDEREHQPEDMAAPLADLSNNSIRLWDSGHYNYVIPLNRIKEPADLVSWVHHLCEKNWVTTDHITGLLELTCQVRGWNLHRNI